MKSLEGNEYVIKTVFGLHLTNFRSVLLIMPQNNQNCYGYRYMAAYKDYLSFASLFYTTFRSGIIGPEGTLAS